MNMAKELKKEKKIEKSFIISVYEKYYMAKARILKNLEDHIGKICLEQIISSTERLTHMAKICEIIDILNYTLNYYNNLINDKGYTENKYIMKYDEKQFKIAVNNTDDTNDVNELVSGCFMSCDKDIEELMSLTGAKSINDIFLQIEKQSLEDIQAFSNQKSLTYVLNDFFVPVQVEHNKNNKKNVKHINRVNNMIKISQHNNKNTDKYDILFDNYYKIDFGGKIIIYGYFECASLNTYLRISGVKNDYIISKVQEINDILFEKIKRTKSKINLIPTQFKELYIKNMSVGDIISCDKQTLIENISDDYSLYEKYTTIGNFKFLFNEFIQASYLIKLKIIKFLLFKSNTTDAGLLFGLTKDAKIGSNFVSDIIYKNLNFELQTKLSNTNVSLKSEFDKINDMNSDDIDLKKQIALNKNMPIKVKKIALEKINEMKSGNSEFSKQMLFVKTLVDFPWTGDNDGDVFSMYKNDISKWGEIMKHTNDKLNNKVYGHNECKETIIELLGKWFSNPKSLGKAIGLWGPPGVGKTLIAKELGDALGIPYTKINLGGMEDGAVLSGHSITYSGAVPGLIIKRMVDAGKSRCIMFFDELDKACYHHGRNEIYDILMHVIDSTTNNEFNDKFFQDINFPINKVLFVFSFNDKNKIDQILLDRMEILKVDAYTMEDKVNIVNKFLLNDIITDIGMNDLTIKINDQNIMYIIDSYTQEPGVRSIKRKLEKILLKLNKEKIFKTGPFKKSRTLKTLEITRDMIDEYLTKPTIIVKKICPISEIGVVNGLYATVMGDGGIIPILIYKNQMGNNTKFTLKLTGKQGKVMKESVSFAFTIAMSIIKQKHAKLFFANYQEGLHVHTPDGATAKDGPSAGSAFTLAFISRILNKRVKNNIGITGELDRTGTITAIGGLEYKLPGAKKAGVNLVFVPRENEKDVLKIKDHNKTLFDNNFKYLLVDHIREVLDIALIEDNYEYTENQVCDKTFDSIKYIDIDPIIKNTKIIDNKPDKSDKNIKHILSSSSSSSSKSLSSNSTTSKTTSISESSSSYRDK